MASYQFLADVRRRDPLWYRAAETCIAVAVVVSNLFSDALEDGTARIAARFRRFK